MKTLKSGKGFDLKFQLTPKQLEFRRWYWNPEGPWQILFGGARGGGKSHLVRLLALETSFGYNVPVLIFRRIRENLLRNHVDPFLRSYPELRPFFNKSEFVLYNPVTGDPAIIFGYAEREEEIAKFQGSEFGAIFIDEATQATQYQMEFLSTCLRDATGTIPNPKLVLTANPGGPSHLYLKRLFIDRLYEENENPDDYKYFPARVWDNPYFVITQLEKDKLTVQDYLSWNETKQKAYMLSYSHYAKLLAKLPEQMRKAFLEGSWEDVMGAFFKFARSVHVIEESEYISWEDIRRAFKLIGSIDYGGTTVLEVLGVDKDGRVIVFDELVHKGASREQKIADTVNFLYERGLENILILGDTNMFIKDAFDVQTTKSPAADYREAGIKLIPVSKSSPNSRPYRHAVNDYIKDLLDFESEAGKITKQPRLKIYARCKELINTLPALETDIHDPDDFVGGDIDHAFDSMKYGALWLVKPRLPEPELGTKPNGRHANREFRDVVKAYRDRQNRAPKEEMAYFLH